MSAVIVLLHPDNWLEGQLQLISVEQLSLQKDPSVGDGDHIGGNVNFEQFSNLQSAQAESPRGPVSPLIH